MRIEGTFLYLDPSGIKSQYSFRLTDSQFFVRPATHFCSSDPQKLEDLGIQSFRFFLCYGCERQEVPHVFSCLNFTTAVTVSFSDHLTLCT